MTCLELKTLKKVVANIHTARKKEVNRMKFIEIENKLINLDNVTGICKFDEGLIRICLSQERDYIDITKENEEELNKVWERLKEVCI